jgi:hypothetical protein
MLTNTQEWYASITAIVLWFVVAVLVDRLIILRGLFPAPAAMIRF